MPDVEQNVVTNVKVFDLASKPLATIASAAGRMTHVFDKATGVLGHFGLAAGAMFAGFEVKEALQTTIEHLRTVQRIGDMASVSAGKAEALVTVFKNAGVEMTDAERIIMSMTRRTATFESKILASGHATGGTALLFSKMGVDIRKGPLEAMTKLSIGVQKGNIHVEDLSAAFGILGPKAYSLYKTLKKGPEAIKDAIAEQKKYGIANEKNMLLLQRYIVAQRGIKNGWEKIKLYFGAAVLPLVTRLMEYGAKNMDKWLEKAKNFGEALSGFLTRHHALLLKIGKVMIANYTIQKLTGTSIAMWIPKLSALAGRGIGAIAPKAVTALAGGAAGGGGLAAAASGIGAAIAAAAGPILIVVAALGVVALAIWATWKGISKNIDGVKTTMSNLWERISIHVHAIGSAVGKMFDPIINLFNRAFSKTSISGKFFFTLIPRIINNQLSHIEKILHLMRAAQRFGEKVWALVSGMFSGVWDQISAVVGAISQAFSGVWNGIVDGANGVWSAITSGVSAAINTAIEFYKPLITWIKDAAGKVADVFRSIFDKLYEYLKPIIDFFSKQVETAKTMASIVTTLAKQSWMEIDLETQREQLMRKSESAAARMGAKVSPERGGVNFNFPNAKFDITQKFAEGFDPDRVAVAFSNDIASLGERKLQSGFSPIFGI